MPKHLIAFYPGAKKISVNKGENLLPAAMEAEMHIDTSCDGIVTCGKCEIKPPRTEPASPKHPKTKSILRKKQFLQGPSDCWMERYLFRNNERVTNPKC